MDVFIIIIIVIILYYIIIIIIIIIIIYSIISPRCAFNLKISGEIVEQNL